MSKIKEFRKKNSGHKWVDGVKKSTFNKKFIKKTKNVQLQIKNLSALKRTKQV